MKALMTACDTMRNYGLPCSLTGAMMALTGVHGVEILVNGPSSCTGFATGILDGCHPAKVRNAMGFSRLSANGHPRIPCSEITDADVILGISEKLTEAVEKLDAKRACDCIAIVNSCSLSLIGEDVANIMQDHAAADRIFYLESTGCGKSLAKGYSEALIQLIDRVSQPHEVADSATVNILGFCIGQYSWKHDLKEIRRLMALAGIRVNTALSARCTLDDIRDLPAAALNVVITPEYGLEIAEFLKRQFGTPYITTPHMPIGFDATRQLMDDVLSHFNLAAPAALIHEETYHRREAVLALSHASRTEYIRGLPVAVFGEWDFAVGSARFLKDYLGCDPVILGIQGHETGDHRASETIDGSLFPSTEIMLNPDADQVMATIDEKKPVILFGSSFEEFILTNMTYTPKYFIQTTTPGLNRANLIYRPTIGFAGALTFIEGILDQPLTARYPYTMEEISP